VEESMAKKGGKKPSRKKPSRKKPAKKKKRGVKIPIPRGDV
jgi:hypothetical protein